MKRGFVVSWVLVTAGIFLLVVGVVSITLATKFGGAGGFYDIARFLPSFGAKNNTKSQELGIIGVQLIHPKAVIANSDYSLDFSSPLKFYTGESWTNYGKDAKVKVGSRELDSETVREALLHYYIYTTRIGEGVFDYSSNMVLRATPRGNNPYRSLFIEKGYFVLIGEYKVGESGSSKDLPVVKLSFNNHFFDGKDNPIDSTLNSDLKLKIINYRDQILADKDCELFVKLADNNYDVKKLGDYLFVDLNNPMQGNDRYSECVKEDTILPIEVTPIPSYDLMKYSLIKYSDDIDLIYYDHAATGFYVEKKHIGFSTHRYLCFDPATSYSFCRSYGEVVSGTIRRNAVKTSMPPEPPLTLEAIGHLYSLDGVSFQTIPTDKFNN